MLGLISFVVFFIALLLYDDGDVDMYEFKYNKTYKAPAISNEFFERSTHYFESKELNLESFLYRPKGVVNPPVIVIGNGVCLPKDAGMDNLAHYFVRQGFAVLLFDFRRIGGSEGLPRHYVKISDQVFDWEQAIKYATRNITGVDGKKLGVLGYSLGGGNLISLASNEERLKKENITISAMVLLAPAADGVDIAASLTKHGLSLSHLQGLIFSLKDVILSFFGKNRYLKLAGPENTIAVLAGEDYNDYLVLVDKAQKNGIWQNKVTAASVLDGLITRPILYAESIKVPTLIIGGSNDLYVSESLLQSLHEKIPHSTLKMLPTGHFGPLLGMLSDTAAIASHFFGQHLAS